VIRHARIELKCCDLTVNELPRAANPERTQDFRIHLVAALVSWSKAARVAAFNLAHTLLPGFTYLG
jgi:hypothetical protein